MEIIYVNGKNNAQYVLDTLYRLFKDVEGLDIAPRYNEKITSLIYYAQSHGDRKVLYPQEYVQPNMEVFAPDYVDPEHPVDYRLNNPAKGNLSVLFPKTQIEEQQLPKRLTNISYESFKGSRQFQTYPEQLMPLNKALNIDAGGYYQNGYIYIAAKEGFNGPEARDLAEGVKERSVQEYKIHLMPKSADDVMLILENIFKEATIHEKLKNVIHNMKFKPGIDFSYQKGIWKNSCINQALMKLFLS